MAVERQTANDRRWRRFSLRALLVMVTVFAVWLGFRANEAHVQRRVVRNVTQLGGTVAYDFEFEGIHRVRNVEPPGPRWLRDLIGDDYFVRVVGVHLVRIDRSSSLAPTLVRDIARLPRLRDLTIFHRDIADDDMEEIAQIGQLRNLKLHRASLTDEGVAHLRHHRTLERLWLQGPGFSDTSLEAIGTIESLRELSINGREIRGFRTISRKARIDHPASDVPWREFAMQSQYYSHIRLCALLSAVSWSFLGLSSLAQEPNTRAEDDNAKKAPVRVDLLDVVDTSRHVVQGSWRKTADSGLVVDKLSRSAIRIPIRMTGSYHLHVEFTRQSSAKDVSIVFPVANRRCQYFISLPNNICGFATVRHSNPAFGQHHVVSGELANGERQSLDFTIKVLANGDAEILVLLNDKRHLQWKGHSSELATSRYWSCRIMSHSR